MLRTLSLLGGEGTPGDLVALVARPRDQVEAAIEGLMATHRVQVKVTEAGEVVYRLGRAGTAVRADPIRGSVYAPGVLPANRRTPTPKELAPASVRFDRKTLQLIRSLDGVISLAELVEHTGTSVAEARREMARLVAWYGGEPHPSLDGHVVYAFPLVMASVHAPPRIRQPRPAWMRFNDPMGSRRFNEGFSWVGRLAYSLGLLSLGRRALRHLRSLRALRFRQRRVLRRLALGHVFETALAGRGVVTLSSTCRYLTSRAGGRPVRPARAEAVLRGLAREFDALITREGDELFFGFRNVKRQFLASQIVRRELSLGRRVTGRTIFDSGDSPRDASEREKEAFDRELDFDSVEAGAAHRANTSSPERHE